MTLAQPDLAVWPTAVNAALLGTDRAGLTLPSGEGSLGSACTQLAGFETDPSAALLHVAAAASVYRRCGWIPVRTDEAPPAACPPDARVMCPPAAAGLLRRILQGEHASLVGEWLTLAARQFMRVPADTLPELLDRALRDSRLRSPVITVAGTRATWLAAHNPDWSFAIAGASADALAELWEQSADGRTRLAALQQLRVLDPDRARSALEKSWAEESPAERGAFVGALVHGLSPADEPFLERALDDRRKEVRQNAAALLARLPTSALVARMVVRAKALVSLGRSGLLKRLRVDVTLPTAADDALVRDGVEAKPPVGIGERAWWLAQILAAVPPSTWTLGGSVDAKAVLGAVDGHEWREPLVAGWLIATERHRDATWAEALWAHDRVARIDPKWGAPQLERVFTTIVPADRVDAELRKSIGAGRDVLRGNHPVLSAILGWPNEWSDPLARSVAYRIKEYASERLPLTSEYGVRALLERSGHAVPISATGAFIDDWPEQDSDAWRTWAPAIDALASVLRFRNDLHLAFNEAPAT